MAHSKSYHESNNGGFMADSPSTTNDTSQVQSGSFVGKVRSLLSTSTISKWFSHAPTANRIGQVRPRTEMEADDTSNDSDDESEDYNQAQSKVIVPPAKRLKTTIDLPLTSNVFSESASASVSHNNNRLSAISTFNVDVIMRNPKRLVLNRRNNLNIVQRDTTNTIIQNDSDDSGESTSGYSSMPRLPQTNKQEETEPQPQNQQQEDDTNASMSAPRTSNSTMLNLHSRSLFDTSHDRSLFQSTNTSFGSGVGRPASLSTRRPAFSGANLSNNTTSNSLTTSSTSTTVGDSSGGLLDRTIATRRIYNSPFYSGRTLYGGASNLTMGRCFNQLQGGATVIPPITATATSTDSKSKESDCAATMLSTTARRILNTLESYTLESTSKKMPNINSSSSNNSRNRRQLRQEHLFTAPSSSSDRRPYDRRLNNLQVPNVAQLLRMKERLQKQTVQVRQMMQQQQLQQQPVATVGGKIRTKVTPSTRKQKQGDVEMAVVGEGEENTEQRLSSIQLPISALPTFTDLYLPLPNHKANTNLTATTSSTNTVIGTPAAVAAAVATATTATPSVTLTTKPALVSSTGAVKPVTQTTSTTFSSSTSSSMKIAACLDTIDSGDHMFVFAKPLVLLDSGLNGSKLRNIAAINNFKFSVPLNQMLVDVHRMTKITTTTTTDNNSATMKQQPIVASSTEAGVQWECDVCLVRNPSVMLTCAACTSPKVTSASASVPVAVAVPAATSSSAGIVGWGGIFKPPSNRWECNVCLVTNANDKVRCAACETARPGRVPPTTPAPSTTSSTSKKGGTWECPSCMVRNQTTVQKCVCCETLQPGLNVSGGGGGGGGGNSSLVTKYNFGITPLIAATSSSVAATSLQSTGFTFGIPPAPASAANVHKTVSAAIVGISSSTCTTTAATSNNTHGFTFGIPASGAATAAVVPVVPTTTTPTPTSNNNNNGSSSSTVSSTTTLNQQQQQHAVEKTLPNGMISSSSGSPSSSAFAIAAPLAVTTTSTTVTIPTTTSTSTTTSVSAPVPVAIGGGSALAAIKFGVSLTGGVTATATGAATPPTPPSFIFGRPADVPVAAPTQDVSSSTSGNTTKQQLPTTAAVIPHTPLAAPLTLPYTTAAASSSGSFVSSTAAPSGSFASAASVPSSSSLFQSKVQTAVANPFAFAFNKPPTADTQTTTTTTTMMPPPPTTATPASVVMKPPMFSFGSAPAPAPAHAPAASSSNSMAIQQQHCNGPFMFGGKATGGAAIVTATPAPAPATATAHTGLFSFGAAANNGSCQSSSNIAPATFGFGSNSGAPVNTAAVQPVMTFGSSQNLFGQPKVKNGGFDFSGSMAAKPSFQSTSAGFNFTSSSGGGGGNMGGANAATSPQSHNRGLFSFGGSGGVAAAATAAPAPALGTPSTNGGGTVVVAAVGGATIVAPFTFGAVSSSSSNNDGGNKQLHMHLQQQQQHQQQPLSFGGITSSSSSSCAPASASAPSSINPHSNIFGTPTPSAAVAAADNSLGIGGGVSQMVQQRRIIKKAIRRTNTQPR